MSIDEDLVSLADFERRASDCLAGLKATGRPVILTVDGKAEFVVQDARSYRRLLDQVERSETIRAVKAGIASADRGEGRPIDEAFDELEREIRGKAGA